MTRRDRSNDCDAIVIGAGPYGLATAAHLKARQIATHVFGQSMSFWQQNMPKGMRLRSPWGATTISDPAGALSLDAYVTAHRIAPEEPLPLETFVNYGTWFAHHAVPDLDGRVIDRIETTGNGFRAVPTDGEAIHGKRVVIATGLARQEFRPAAFAGVPAALASHACDHDNLDAFRGKRVAVVGRGQSACESAVLLKEAGAEVEIISRGPIHWVGSGTEINTARQRAAKRFSALLATPSGVGPFPLSWVVEVPHFVRRLPNSSRAWFNRASLRPGAAAWLQPRFAGVQVRSGVQITGARAKGEQIELQFVGGQARFDHVLLATGYRFDVAKVGIFAPDLLAKIVCRDGSPVLSGGFESSVPGLHFVGSSAVSSIGPLMRFVAGTAFAAREVARTIAAGRNAMPRAQKVEERFMARATGTMPRA